MATRLEYQPSLDVSPMGGIERKLLKRAKEAIEGFIEGLQRAGEPIPEEVTPAELETVTV